LREAIVPPAHHRPPKDAPPHPGQHVRAAIIGPLGLSVKEAARALGVHRVLNEQANLSSEMAIRLEKAFGADMEELMRMQNAYDIACARAHKHQIDIPRFQPETNDNAQARLI
jgi:addiction module HigA family antidote